MMMVFMWTGGDAAALFFVGFIVLGPVVLFAYAYIVRKIRQLKTWWKNR